MNAALLYLVVGAVLVTMALAGSYLRRLPLTTGVLYLAIGLALSPLGVGLIRIDPFRDAAVLEVITEIAVIISLFTAGLKLRAPFRASLWRQPVRLAFVSMPITVALIALAGVALLGLPLGAAILLGAILAPTDPVLASDVQVSDPGDQDRLRFALTGEAGLNDGAAFPFVLLGLGLLGARDLGPNGLRWLGIDVAWATVGGLAVGAIAGTLVARLVLYLRREHKEAVGLDDFLALGLIALSYGAAVALGAYGFLAVFAAGLALRRIERQATQEAPFDEIRDTARQPEGEALATHPERAPAYMAEAVLGFNEQLERMAEVGVVILVGAMLGTIAIPFEVLWLAPLVLLLIRPVSVFSGLIRSHNTGTERALIGWFGIRGIGSVFYLAYAIRHGLDPVLAGPIAGLTLAIVAISIIVHGLSVSPLMRRRDVRREAAA